MIAIYTLTSSLHDAARIDDVTRSFLDSLDVTTDYLGSDLTGYGTHDLDVIYVRTGGSEGLFLKALPQLLNTSRRPFYLLTNGKNNSLAAALEILSYLNNNGYRGEVIHGDIAYISSRLKTLEQTNRALAVLSRQRLGVIGKPSDWLISSVYDAAAVRRATGIEIVDIPMEEVLDAYHALPETIEPSADLASRATAPHLAKAVDGAERLYLSIRDVVKAHDLTGFTIRCFDLLTAVRNTGCWALARLNAEGITAGCEGDVPSLLSMAIARALTGHGAFQSNPSRIDPVTGQLTFAHCTIPLDIVDNYSLDTHFESGIGIGIVGDCKSQPVTLFKTSGDLGCHFVTTAHLERCETKADLCRTQFVITLDDAADAQYFLKRPIGNHHIIVPGNIKPAIEALFENF